MSEPASHLHTIIVTGGIVSGIGKGITAASLGRLLIDNGYSVSMVKADPYLNQDAGTMNPFQHGEVFVTDDGTESDLDLGHYERFLDVNLTKNANFTGGAVYRSVMDLERDGEFLGKTIQVIPHVTDEIKRRIGNAAQDADPDFLLVEIGGTVGDIEALPFIEAARQYKLERPGQTAFVHVVKMDYLYPSDEGKTKPIQHSLSTMRSYGLQPDILIVRCKRPLSEDERAKLAMFTGVPASRIIAAHNAASLYEIPAQLNENGLTQAVFDSFNIKKKPAKKSTWDTVYRNLNKPKSALKVGLVGKYVDHDDAYISVMEAVNHAGIHHQVTARAVPIDAEDPELLTKLGEVDALVVPGGFGNRGTEGKIAAIAYARDHGLPFLGICLGLQTAVIESARRAGLSQATSTEFDAKTKEPVIDILPDQIGVKKKGGTMRLGNYPAVLAEGSLAERLYAAYRPEELSGQTIQERHRHRYEVNPAYHAKLKEAGLVLSGLSPDGSLVEFIELDGNEHPYFIATQAHPELRSRPNRPHPLFAGLVAAALKKPSP